MPHFSSSPLPSVETPTTRYTELADIGMTSFRPLEWLVIAIARRDSLASICRPSRLSVALGSLFGSAATTSLADPDLETLRHAAVLAWHRETPNAELQDRLRAAGYGPAHERLLAASVAQDLEGLTSTAASKNAMRTQQHRYERADLH